MTRTLTVTRSRLTAVSQGTNGTVTFTASGVTYTPDPNFHGSDSFTYTVSDGHGGTDTATVAVTATAVNDAPEAKDDAVSTAEDTAAPVAVLTNDTDVDGDTLSGHSRDAGHQRDGDLHARAA